jgi:tRNA (guanine37-N1)-methyltransferase
MKIDILTLFPNMFNGFKDESIIKRAIDDEKVTINTINFRDFATNKHKKVDDTPYGGGSGMVLMCQPIFDAVESIRKKNSKVILLSPQGKTFSQEKAYELSKEEHLIFICGHYEGFDERIKTICDDEISIGDYVLTGGELPAMVVCDSVVRLIPGVIDGESVKNESFNDNLLDYPTYTKPRNYKGMKVPDVLLSGNHEKIKQWRKEKRLLITNEKRPDLLENKVKLERSGLKKNKNKIYVDDIKNIKVTEVKQVKKTGIYKVSRDDKIRAITILNPSMITGYKLKGKNSSNSVNKILVVKNSFIKKVALKNVKKKVDILAYRFNLALSSEDDDDATSRVLGEAEMLKQMIINMYANYLGGENLDKIIKNINLLTNEFVKAKTIQNSFFNKEKQEQRRM